MKKLLLSLLSISALFFTSCERSETVRTVNPDTDLVTSTSQVIAGKYVVLFEDQGLLKSAAVGEKVSPDAVRQTAYNIFNSIQLPSREPDLIYSSAIRGIAVAMTSDEALKLAKAEGVKGVYPDIMITLDLPSVLGKPAPATTVQKIQWGVTRVGGGTTTPAGSAWIIDTGIDLDHPDLNVDKVNGWNFVTNTQSADDDNGHGTHCAGIVAAIDNTIGVVV